MENAGWKKVQVAFWSISFIIIFVTLIHVGTILLAGRWGVEHMQVVVNFSTDISKTVIGGIVSVLSVFFTNRETLKMLVEKFFGSK